MPSRFRENINEQNNSKLKASRIFNQSFGRLYDILSLYTFSLNKNTNNLIKFLHISLNWKIILIFSKSIRDSVCDSRGKI